MTLNQVPAEWLILFLVLQSFARTSRDLLLVRREVGLVAVILIIIIPATILNPRMLGVSNLKALSMDVALLSIITVAQMLVLITRNIDLSVASVISLSAYVSAMVLKASPQTPIPIAILMLKAFFCTSARALAGSTVWSWARPSVPVSSVSAKAAEVRR
jgi:rhamnose transport system ATP-binding protein